jgi:hypothetical protein
MKTSLGSKLIVAFAQQTGIADHNPVIHCAPTLKIKRGADVEGWADRHTTKRRSAVSLI